MLMAAIMVENSASTSNTSSTKIHPFFSAPKNAAKDIVSTATTPVTPDPSCSPNSADNESVTTTADSSRKRKRRQVVTVHDEQDGQDGTSSSSAPKPQKLLKLNRTTGTIGSPPRIKTPAATKKKTRKGAKSKTLLVSVMYGNGDDASRLRIGQQIDNILATAQAPITQDITNVANALPSTPPSSRETDDELQKENIPKKHMSGKGVAASSTPKQPTPKKATHPFFQGKAKPSNTVEEKQKPSTKVFFTSNSSYEFHRRPAIPNFSIPSVGTNSKILKVPGARHPAWPWEGIVHARGDTPSLPHPLETTQYESLCKKRKAKGQLVQTAESESILHQTALDLNLKQIAEELKACDDDNFQPRPSILRIPSRHFESGKKLQERIAGELKTLRRNGDNSKTHAAIAHAYNSIQIGLSAFDKSTCETAAWAQKYAPSSAELVLQSGHEAELLRDWLVNLKVQAVDTGAGESGTRLKSVALAKSKGKRKKKLDGFIVSSDDEADELNEIHDAERDEPLGGSLSNTKKTVIRSSSRSSRDNSRLANAVVLSGPHGCGKTATVYAIAKELDFEVFEINPGTRRSGRDILEKVGDMTRNHLVQHQQHTEDAPRDGSGKQGTMAAFFKPKATAAPERTKKPTELPAAKDAKKPTKAQKQSLILLEEVDVLYEEDKQFWATVISMISQSKRPFIMTCNDEALLPLQSLNLHGIFRFSAPPKDLAVDLLILVAANEGHALRRQAVETLYDSRCHDLRASITELNYWCQIGVGDIQGGFNWFYPRWPKGSDIDEEGRSIRVVSQDTYRAGMGWLSRDSAMGSSSPRSTQQELHQQIGQNWSLDVYDSLARRDLSSWAITATGDCSAKQRLGLLESLDSFASLMSDTDFGGADFSTSPNRSSLDASIPELPTKVREDFIVGRQLLEVSPLVQYDTTRLDISSSLKSLSRAHFRDQQSTSKTPGAFEPLDEAGAIATLKSHLGESSASEPAITRLDYSLAFDSIAASEKTVAAGYLDPSAFDGTMKSIALDLAPYVRSIVASDQRWQQERLLRSNLLSEGGQPGKKRMRTTRSAYSALEGGTRASTRREKYFSADVNPHLVMRTGGKGWDAVATAATVGYNAAGSDTGSPCGQPEEASAKLD
ncbi:P-loop containing nucleoside triphosphate hydrolase protein [Hypoxylon rubiginosum]|uniref:P-loop containing nucleoside triphosphate hydrolase protein n=1 Tax=Hypoxylon rubiginosum TaxID=110542 RepID=A0ACB9ZAI8_9PEZI|nr:P-loop containing nucleoside triphosphate hydrolase protein [Hypoxylon rubiginosum]